MWKDLLFKTSRLKIDNCPFGPKKCSGLSRNRSLLPSDLVAPSVEQRERWSIQEVANSIPTLVRVFHLSPCLGQVLWSVLTLISTTRNAFSFVLFCHVSFFCCFVLCFAFFFVAIHYILESQCWTGPLLWPVIEAAAPYELKFLWKWFMSLYFKRTTLQFWHLRTLWSACVCFYRSPQESQAIWPSSIAKYLQMKLPTGFFGC